jgi:hypothetical protein
MFSDYLCSPDANIYDIGKKSRWLSIIFICMLFYYVCYNITCNGILLDFTRFCIRDLETGMTLFEIAKPLPSGKTTSVEYFTLNY